MYRKKPFEFANLSQCFSNHSMFRRIQGISLIFLSSPWEMKIREMFFFYFILESYVYTCDVYIYICKSLHAFESLSIRRVTRVNVAWGNAITNKLTRALFFPRLYTNTRTRLHTYTLRKKKLRAQIFFESMWSNVLNKKKK